MQGDNAKVKIKFPFTGRDQYLTRKEVIDFYCQLGVVVENSFRCELSNDNPQGEEDDFRNSGQVLKLISNAVLSYIFDSGGKPDHRDLQKLTPMLEDVCDRPIRALINELVAIVDSRKDRHHPDVEAFIAKHMDNERFMQFLQRSESQCKALATKDMIRKAVDSMMGDDL